MRTPESSEGPKRIGDILGAVMAKYGFTATTARGELERAWLSVAEEDWAGSTKLGSLRRGVLEILVDNSMVLQELEGFRKRDLLGRLQAMLRHNTVNSLKFRKM